MRVTFRGREAAVEVVTPERLVVRVPEGARTGDVIVQAGALTSEPAAFTVLGRGLLASYYRFEESIVRMPNFAAHVPDITRYERTLRFGEGYSFGLPYESERFGAVFAGKLSVPREGEWTFHLYSDDGSRLLIDGALVVDNDGIHGHRRREGKAVLTAGEHAIRLEFFQNRGAASLDLFWRPPGGRWARVGERNLFPE